MSRTEDIWAKRKQKSKKQVKHALSCGTHRERKEKKNRTKLIEMRSERLYG